jgi:hypothetical protein
MEPFMGLKDWNKIGMSVAESARRLHRIGFLDRQLMRIEAGRMIDCADYEIKGALAKMAWLDATHHDQLRVRCKQLRMSTSAFDKSPDPHLKLAATKALDSGSTLLMLIALFEVIKPAQIEAIQAYVDAAQPLVDMPTLHIFRHQMLDREDQLTWGREAIAALTAKASDDELAFARHWKSYLSMLIAAAGCVDGTLEMQTLQDEFQISTTPYKLPEHSARDERFKTAILKFEGIPFENNDEDRFKMMMYSRYFEMSPAEGVAYMLYQTEGRPWAFYLDTARHLWDEVRHTWFGEAALRKKGYDVYEVPNWIGFYEICKNLFELDEAYIHLTIAIEKAAMKYPPGKREEWEFARDVAKDPLMTTFQDFDWADEVVHAGFGEKWGVQVLYKGNTTEAIKAGDATWSKRMKFMSIVAMGQYPPQSPYAGNY